MYSGEYVKVIFCKSPHLANDFVAKGFNPVFGHVLHVVAKVANSEKALNQPSCNELWLQMNRTACEQCSASVLIQSKTHWGKRLNAQLFA